MEQRLAVICSHLRQIKPPRSPPRPPPPIALEAPLLVAAAAATSPISRANCDGGGGCQGGSGRGGCRRDESSSDCVFCRIVRGESPAFKLYEDDTCLCILDSNPLSRGHSLIIPKSHFSSLEVTPPRVVAAMCSRVPFLSKAIMKAANCDSFNLLVNNGAASGQVIFHTHLHIIPRRGDDKLWTSESVRRKRLKLGKETTALVERIREQLPRPPKETDSCEAQESKLGENSQS